MGGNGTASVNGSIASSERQYVSHGTYHDPVYGDIEIVEWTGGDKNKSPEESNSAPRMYVTFYKDGSGVNEIAKYGADHKKEWAIHTQPHNSKKARRLMGRIFTVGRMAERLNLNGSRPMTHA